MEIHGNHWKPLEFAGNHTKTVPEGLHSSKAIEILKKWSWSPPEPKIHGNRILIRDVCQKYENMSATEGNKHIFAVQKIGKNSMEMRPEALPVPLGVSNAQKCETLGLIWAQMRNPKPYLGQNAKPLALSAHHRIDKSVNFECFRRITFQ